MVSESTIAAIATPPGFGGIGIVRLSGPKAKELLKSLWKSSHTSGDNFVTHRLYYGNFVSSSTGELIDKGLATWMKAPHSYTGEDVVEIQIHGSPLLLEKILQALLAAGATLAEPGEFTKRAYLNGKMDLAQAEAVADLIAASSEMGLNLAKEHLAGRLSKRIHEFQKELVRLRAYVEASIDFPEEDIELIQKEGIQERLVPIQVALTELVATYEEGRLFREGIRTVLVGKTNVGKSSLMNALLGIDRAIVHPTPGTTRDVIESPIQFSGFTFLLHDTAGLREAGEEVEAIGVEKSRALLQEADLVLWVMDGAHPLDADDFDFLSELNMEKTLLCINKKDLGLVWDPKNFILKEDENRLVHLSAVTGEALKELQEKMVDWMKKRAPKENSGIRITKQRHKLALEGALKALQFASEALENRDPVEMIALHLKKSHEHLGAITGADISEDLLDTIFSDFCIGK